MSGAYRFTKGIRSVKYGMKFAGAREQLSAEPNVGSNKRGQLGVHMRGTGRDREAKRTVQQEMKFILISYSRVTVLSERAVGSAVFG